MTNREKIIIIVMIALVALLVVKSFVLDEYKPANPAEEAYKLSVEEIIENKYAGGFLDFFIVRRVVKITEMSEREKTYKDLDGNTQVTTGTYKAKVRKYILGILPFSEESILEGVSK